MDLNYTWHRLNPSPDTVAALNKLKQDYLFAPFQMATFTYWSISQSTQNCLGTLFSLLKISKPTNLLPKPISGVADLLNVAPSQVMMVATHQDDLDAARGCGLRTAYTERPFEYGAAQLKDSSPVHRQ